MRTADFYLLEDDVPKNCFKSVCQIIDQMCSQGLTLYLHCKNEKEASQFDDALWTFQDIRFVPHELITDRVPQRLELPICIIGSSDTTGSTPSCEVLFNLAKAPPPFFSEYKKIIEIVPVDEAKRIESRKRYKHYQKEKYQIKTQHYKLV